MVSKAQDPQIGTPKYSERAAPANAPQKPLQAVQQANDGIHVIAADDFPVQRRAAVHRLPIRRLFDQ